MILAASSDAGGVCRWHLREAAAPRRAKARCPTFLSALRDSHRPARLRRLLHGCWGERLRRLRSHESSRVVKHEGRVPFFCDGWTHVGRTPADDLDRPRADHLFTGPNDSRIITANSGSARRSAAATPRRTRLAAPSEPLLPAARPSCPCCALSRQSRLSRRPPARLTPRTPAPRPLRCSHDPKHPEEKIAPRLGSRAAYPAAPQPSCRRRSPSSRAPARLAGRVPR